MANKIKKPFKIHVKRGDTVLVISGKDKDKRGKVIKALPSEGKIVVEGVNVVKRHTKPRPPQFPQGGIIEKTLPISSCKVMLVCAKCDRPVRVKKQLAPESNVNGYSKRYIRVCSKCGEEITNPNDSKRK